VSIKQSPDVVDLVDLQSVIISSANSDEVTVSRALLVRLENQIRALLMHRAQIYGRIKASELLVVLALDDLRDQIKDLAAAMQ